MSNDLNQCCFIGRLGKDVDTRYMPSGEAVSSFSLAVGSTWKDKQGAKQESTEWVNVSAFGKLAQICSEYLVKGSQIYVSGRMKTDKYVDKNGVEKYNTKIIADRMQMLGSKGEPSAEQMRNRAAAKEVNKPSGGSSGFDDMDDDICFATAGIGQDVIWRKLDRARVV